VLLTLVRPLWRRGQTASEGLYFYQLCDDGHRAKPSDISSGG